MKVRFNAEKLISVNLSDQPTREIRKYRKPNDNGNANLSKRRLSACAVLRQMSHFKGGF